jgi:sugar (pentulose or hexulose) kinase
VRTADIYPYAFAQYPREKLYADTGIQFMNLNTIFQLAAMVRDKDPQLDIAETLLFMPNVLTYLFCGHIGAEYTIATTSQAYDANRKNWDWEAIDALGIPRRLFPKIVPPCTVAGHLRPALCEELHCEPVPVILVGSHDTASAVAAVPATDEAPWAYLSSGTWSLLGVERDKPLINEQALAANYTNEGGLNGKIRFLKNIMGLWLIQESRAEWKRQGRPLSYDDIDKQAAAAAPFRSLIDPNDDSFVAPGDMPGRIAEFCRRGGQAVPDTPGRVARCALESLALRDRQTLDELEQIGGKPIARLHLVGGGAKNLLLNQWTANAVNRPVVAGPVEATALGNILAQGIAVGAVRDLDHARSVIRNSIETRIYMPEQPEEWENAFARYRSLLPVSS